MKQSAVALSLAQDVPLEWRRSIWLTAQSLCLPLPEVLGRESLCATMPRSWRAELGSALLWQRAERVCLWADAQAVDICPWGTADYPPLLAYCHDAPLLLYRRGRMPQWSDIALPLAVVGARELSSEGRASLRLLLGELAGLVPETLVVSGLAIGADIVAHRTALELGLPTLAVLPTGLDTVYPRRHRADADAILEHGAWLSEYPPFVQLKREHFTERNRIVAGVSRATLLVEAGLPSGTYITALRAWSYDRDVLVVPARIDEPRCRGGYELIVREQASMVASGRDILRVVRGW